MDNKEDLPKDHPANRKIEKDYEKHKDNPGPSEEAVRVKSDERAAISLNWVILISVVVLGLIYLIFFM